MGLRSAWPPVLVVIAAAAILLLMGRPPICACGTVELWVGGTASSKTSQMFADWYSPSHIIHGFLFYAALWLVARHWPVRNRLTAALLLEAAWEIIENTPLIIDRYREATIALGYNGDSVLNSMSDIAMMALGFFAARRLPVWLCAVVVVGLEIAALVAIRDNLTLNVWMLLAPDDSIRAWQAGA